MTTLKLNKIERKRATARAWYHANKDRAKENAARFNEANPDYKIKWRAKNRVKSREYQRLRHIERKDEINAAHRKRYQENRAQVLSRHAEYAQGKGHAKRMATKARRRAKEKNCYVEWGNRFFIEEIYDLAKRRTEMLGYQWDVDHIVPIQSKLVCGLHWEGNLQVIPHTENLKKGNKLRRVEPLLP